MELKNFAQLQFRNRITNVPSFSLVKSPCNKYYVYLRQKEFEIFFVNYPLYGDVKDTINMGQFVLNYPLDWPTVHLEKDLKKVTQSMKATNYVDIILKNKWHPTLAHTKPVNPVKAAFSKSVNNKIFFALLMSSGSFHLYSQQGVDWVECYDIGLDHVKAVQPAEKATNMDTLEIALGSADIVSFDWCDPEGDNLPLIWSTENGRLFHGLFNTTTKELKITPWDCKIPEIKNLQILTTKENPSNLLACHRNGQITMFNLTVTGIQQEVKLWTDSDHIPVKCIKLQSHSTGYRIIIVKSFSLVIFLMDKKMQLIQTIFEILQGPFITALDVLDEELFIVTLVNNKILAGKVSNDKILLDEIKTEFDENYSCAGLVCARNTAIIISAMVASKVRKIRLFGH